MAKVGEGVSYMIDADGEIYERDYDSYKGWSYRDRFGNVIPETDAEARGLQDYQQPVNQWTKTGDGWKNQKGETLTNEQWNKIPASVRQQAGNDPNKLFTGVAASSGNEYSYAPGTTKAIQSLSPDGLEELIDQNAVTYDPRYGLTTQLTNFKPTKPGIEAKIGTGLMIIAPFTGPAAPFLAGAGAALAGGSPLDGLKGAALAGAGNYLGGVYDAPASQTLLGGAPDFSLPTDVTAGGIPGVPTGTDLIAGATGGIGDLTTLGATGGLLGGSAAALPLFADAASTALPALSDGGSWSDLLTSSEDAFTNAGALPATTVSGGAAAATAAGASGAAESALSRIINGTGTTADWAQLAGKLGAAGLGILGSDKQGDAFSDLADKYLNLGAGARARLEASYTDPNSFLSGPDVTAINQRASDAAARSLSTRYGNPALAPNAWEELNRINTTNNWNQLSNYRNQLAAQGGLGVAPAAGFDAGSAGKAGDVYNIGGALLGDVTNPQESMLEQMRKLAGIGGMNLFSQNFAV